MDSEEQTYENIYNFIRSGSIGLPSTLSALKSMSLADKFIGIRLGGMPLTDNTISQRIAPLYAAAHLNLHYVDLMVIMQHLELTPDQVAQGMRTYCLREIETPAQFSTPLQAGLRFDSVVFLQRIAQAWHMGSPDPRKALAELIPWLVKGSEYALAVMSLNIQELSLNHLIDGIEYGQNTNRPTPPFLFKIINSHDQDTLIRNVRDVCREVQCFEHCPDNSIPTLLEMAGAFHPHVLRKRQGTGQVWETLLMDSLDDEFLWTLIIQTFQEHAKNNPAQLKQLLLSLDFQLGDEEPENFWRDLSSTFQRIADLLQGTSLEDVLCEEAFQIGFFTHHMHENALVKPNFLDPEMIDEWMVESEVGLSLCHRLTKDPQSLVQRLMISQMRNADIPASANQYLLWGRLQHATVGAQKISSDIATQYLMRMVADFQSLKVSGIDTPEKTLEVYEPISRSMSHLCKRLAQRVDYTQLKDLPLDQRNDLALWGLDLSNLGITHEGVMTHRLASDLSL